MNGVSFILLHVGEDRKHYPSRFSSIVFNDCESRYSQAKLELFRLFRTLKQTQLFTIGVRNFIVEMDAKFIKGMLNSPALHPNDAINHWISAILVRATLPSALNVMNASSVGKLVQLVTASRLILYHKGRVDPMKDECHYQVKH